MTLGEQIERLTAENMALKVEINLLKNKLDTEEVKAIEAEAKNLTK